MGLDLGVVIQADIIVRKDVDTFTRGLVRKFSETLGDTPHEIKFRVFDISRLNDYDDFVRTLQDQMRFIFEYVVKVLVHGDNGKGAIFVGFNDGDSIEKVLGALTQYVTTWLRIYYR